MTSFCKKCGGPIMDQQEFCARCGTRAHFPETQAAPVAPAKRFPLNRLIFIAVLVVALLAGTALYYRRAAPLASVTPNSSGQLATPTADLMALPGSVFEVTYSPDTIVIDRATALKSLKSVSADESTLVFEHPDEKLLQLKAGSVMLLQELAVRKVTAVIRQGSQLIVGTEPAALTDAIAEGNIQFEAPVDFSTATAEGRPPPSAHAALFTRLLNPLPVVQAATIPPVKGKFKEWDYTLTVTPSGGQLNLDLTVEKKLRGIEVSLTGTGYLQNFTTSAAIQIHEGVLTDMKYANKNLNGKMNFTWTCKTTAADFILGKPEIKIPANISIPLPIGGLPFTLEISESMILRPGPSGPNQIASGKFNVTYNGTDRFSMSGDSSGEQAQTAPEILNTFGVSVAPMAFVGALAMPRLELKLSGMGILKKLVPTELADAAAGAISKLIGKAAEGAVEEHMKSEAAAYVEIVSTIGFIASGPLNIVPCQKITITSTVKVGAGADFLGKSVGAKEVELVTESREEKTPPNVVCGDS